MISKSDWQAAAREASAADRQRLGEPPTAEEVRALLRDELSSSEAARVRALLVAYPDLARTLVTPLPQEDAQSGEAGYLPEEELDRQWHRLRGRVRDRKIAAMTRKQRGQTYIALAASMMIGILSVLLVQSKLQERDLQRALHTPRIAFERTMLQPAEGHRGPADVAARLSSKEEGHLLSAPLLDPPHYTQYRLELVDVGGATRRVVWHRDGLSRPAEETFEVLVPRGFLPPGVYQLIVYGRKEGDAERIAAYNVVIEP